MSLIKEGAGEPRAVFVSHGLRPDMVGIISRAPQTWIDRSLGQIQGRIPDMGTCAEFKESSEARWKSASGFEARDSRLAIVVPIHDEEKSLETFLEVLRTWNLPGLVRAEIMLITNGCVDNSEDLVQEFLNRIGSPVTERLPRLDRDPELDPIALSVRRGNLKFTHIDTDKAGKANVLSVANDLAVKDGYDILINSDANTYPEPDAIASLYGYSRGLFEEVGNKTVVVSWAYSPSFRPGWEVTLGRALKLLPEIVGTPQVNKAKVGGGLFAWNVNWLNKMGGMPEAILDDEALSVLVRIKEKEIDAIDTAVHHGFHPNNLWDDF